MMDQNRFQALAQAWGGDMRRWPESERAGAETFRVADPARAAAILAEAGAIDAWLDAAPPPQPSAALRDRVVAAAAGTVGLKPRRPLFARPAAWLSGAGWAASCAAGVMVGLQVTQQVHADLQADSVLYQASIPAYDDEEVLG